MLQRHLHLVISYLYYINARRQGEAAGRGGQYEPSLQVVHVRAGVVRQVEAHFATRHRDALGEGGRADARTSHGAVVREVVPPVSHGVDLGATGGHVHRDGVVHARKRPLAAEDGRCRCQHGQLLQPRAIIEEIVPRAGQPFGQGEGGEAGAAIEEAVPHTLQFFGQREGGQPATPSEEVAPHARQSVGEVNGGQPGAASEEIVPHARQSVGEVNGGQPGAASEEAVPHARQSVGEVNGGQPPAIVEKAVPHTRQSVGEANGGQPGAILEEIVPHARHALLHHGGADGGQMVLPRLAARGEVGHVPRAADGERAVFGERPGEVAAVCLRTARAGGDNGLVVAEEVPRHCRSIGVDARGGHIHWDGILGHVSERAFFADGGRRCRQHGQLLHPRAIAEEIGPRAGQPGGQGEGGEAGAAIEKAVPHTTQPSGQREGGQPATPSEEVALHARQSVGEVNGGQPATPSEEVAPHARQSVGEINGGQPGAASEEIVPHARQSVGEVNGGQPGAIVEEIAPHARHALLHHGGADGGQMFFPRLVARGEVGHVPRAADGERAVAGERPGEVAATCLRAARAGGEGRLPLYLHRGQAEGCQK